MVRHAVQESARECNGVRGLDGPLATLRMPEGLLVRTNFHQDVEHYNR